jgi:hypothetical protein
VFALSLLLTLLYYIHKPCKARKRFTMFRIACIVPTGVGAAVGGYAGDAGLVVAYLAQIADEVITHPNVVNAACFNVLPANALYVEGHWLDRFLLGEIGFRRVRANRIGLAIDRTCAPWWPVIQNAVNATLVSTGVQVVAHAWTDTPLNLSLQANAHGWGGQVDGVEQLLAAAQHCLAQGADAIAALAWMDVLAPGEGDAYLQGQGADPIGALEAVISHYLADALGVPVAHSPIFAPEVVSQPLDPRVCAEEISTTYLPCVLMGLSRAPRPVETNWEIAPAELDAIVAPYDAMGGLPMLAALERGIPLILVRENTTTLAVTPEALGLSNAPHLWVVDNYWEAAGLLLAFKQGLDPRVLRRPLTVGIQLQP